MEEYTILAEAIKLLKEADEVLGQHWFEYADGTEYNNDEVIAMSKKIEVFLNKLKEMKSVRQDV